MSEILVCEVEVGKALAPDGGARERCPFLIPDLQGTDYCGYYGKDIEDRRRLEGCEIEVVIRKMERDRERRKKDPNLKKDLEG